MSLSFLINYNSCSLLNFKQFGHDYCIDLICCLCLFSSFYCCDVFCCLYTILSYAYLCFIISCYCLLILFISDCFSYFNFIAYYLLTYESCLNFTTIFWLITNYNPNLSILLINSPFSLTFFIISSFSLINT